MKEIRKLPASAGAQWLLDTFSLYRRAPLQLARIGLTWLLVSWVVTLLSTLIPGAAGMAVQLMTLAISPIMFGGMLYAVGEIDEGRPGVASHLLQPIRDHRVSHLLVPLAIQVLAVLLLGALLFLMIGREGFTAFSEVMTKMEEISRSGQQIKPDDAAALVANLPAKRIALWMLLVFLSAVALSLAMFTQPALVVFDKQSGMHALRLSLQGCIENIGAMFVFAALGLIAAFCMYILFVIVIQIAMLIGGPLAAQLVLGVLHALAHVLHLPLDVLGLQFALQFLFHRIPLIAGTTHPQAGEAGRLGQALGTEHHQGDHCNHQQFAEADIEHRNRSGSASVTVVLVLRSARGVLAARLIAQLRVRLVFVAHALLEFLDRRTEILGAAGQALGAEHQQDDGQHDQPMPDAETAHKDARYVSDQAVEHSAPGVSRRA